MRELLAVVVAGKLWWRERHDNLLVCEHCRVVGWDAETGIPELVLDVCGDWGGGCP